MASVICILFEGDYHYGVAALVNSLHKNGFRGNIYAGYKGALPKWASGAAKGLLVDYPESFSYKYSEGSFLHFIPLKTSNHLTNFKPNFMSLVVKIEKSADAIFYFDPDIVLIAPWSFMEEWISCGVAVCEDVNSPLEEFHPRRIYWRKYFNGFGHTLKFKNRIYVNGGFLGVARKNYKFLRLWQQLQENMAVEIGGLNTSIFTDNNTQKRQTDDYYAFSKTDQDALNATIEGYEENCSYLGKEAMNFSNGLSILPHAAGPFKPWSNNILKRWWKDGKVPAMVEEVFWKNSNNPISSYSVKKVRLKYLEIKLVKGLSRFYRN